MIYVLRGTEQNGESWTIAQLDLSEERPEMKDWRRFVRLPLTYFDGKYFWSNHRAANEIVAFSPPK